MSQPDLFSLVRATDPQTSLDAAIKAARASSAAVVAVSRLMADGVERHDEAIWMALRVEPEPFMRSQSVIRHARKALVDAGKLRATGRTATTSDGAQSATWVKL